MPQTYGLKFSVKSFFAMACLSIGLLACSGPTSVTVLDSPEIQQTLFDGRGINVSRKSSTVVTLSSITTSVPNGDHIEILAFARNERSAPFTLSTASIVAEIDGGRAKIFTYRELEAAEQRSRNIALIATAIGGAADAYNASRPQTTTGSFSSGGNFGTFSSTTTNSANAALASAAVTANTNAQLSSIEARSEQVLSGLQDTYLKPTTMTAGMEYGGVFRIEVPPLASESTQDIKITLRLGADLHQFTLVRSWD